MLRYYKAVTYIALLTHTSCTLHDDYTLTPNDNIVTVGSTLPPFAITMSDGSQITTASLQGKPSVILLFSTTCPDCQRVLPNINTRYQRYSADTTYIAIARQQNAQTITNYWLQHSFTLPVSPQPDTYIYSLFAKQGIPRVYTADSNLIVQRIDY